MQNNQRNNVFLSFWMKKVVYFLRVMKSIRRFANTISTKHGWKVFTEKEMHTLTHALKHAHTRSDTLIHTFSLALSDSPSLSHTRTHARTRTMLRSCRVNTPIHTSSAIKAVSERERARERERENERVETFKNSCPIALRSAGEKEDGPMKLGIKKDT